MRFKQLALIPLVLPVILMLPACGPSDGHEKGGKGGPMGGGMPPSEVAVMTATVQSIPVTFEYVGQTAGSREVEVRARVEQGQSLFTIDPKPFQAALARAVADVAAAEARYDQAKRNAARLKPLYAEKAVSQKENDDAVSAEAIGAAD